jgi:hypothetical protein
MASSIRALGAILRSNGAVSSATCQVSFGAHAVFTLTVGFRTRPGAPASGREPTG